MTGVREHLARRFEADRVVFWHDPDGEYATDLEGGDAWPVPGADRS